MTDIRNTLDPDVLEYIEDGALEQEIKDLVVANLRNVLTVFAGSHPLHNGNGAVVVSTEDPVIHVCQNFGAKGRLSFEEVKTRGVAACQTLAIQMTNTICDQIAVEMVAELERAITLDSAPSTFTATLASMFNRVFLEFSGPKGAEDTFFSIPTALCSGNKLQNHALRFDPSVPFATIAESKELRTLVEWKGLSDDPSESWILSVAWDIAPVVTNPSAAAWVGVSL